MARFRRLSWADRRILLQAAFLVAAFRLGLKFLPFSLLERLGSSAAGMVPAAPGLVVDRLGWAVASAARRIPAASCLTEALAMRFMLARRGISSRICIGVTKNAAGVFQAHAWVEADGRTVIGGPATERYARLVAFGRGRQ